VPVLQAGRGEAPTDPEGAMSDEERLALARTIGHLEGRMDALENDVTSVKSSIKTVDEKLDAIMAKLNQSMGGLAVGKLIAAGLVAVGSAAWAVWSHISR
jgi:ribosome assembly protein YihI (activator of Der GTPase)